MLDDSRDKADDLMQQYEFEEKIAMLVIWVFLITETIIFVIAIGYLAIAGIVWLGTAEWQMASFHSSLTDIGLLPLHHQFFSRVLGVQKLLNLWGELPAALGYVIVGLLLHGLGAMIRHSWGEYTDRYYQEYRRLKIERFRGNA